MGRAAKIVGAALAAALVAYAAAAEAVRRSGAVRQPASAFWRGSGPLLAPYTLWARRHTAGGAGPWPDPDVHFPRRALLLAHWREIRDEALAVYAAGRAAPIRGELFFTRIADDRWKRFYLRWYGPLGADARAACPRTCALLDELPEVRLAMFSILEPGARITPHAGPFAGAKRWHLGLAGTAGARLVVDGAPYEWRDGEDVMFDDTYVHEVAHDGPEPRVVLFCDVETAMDTPRAARLNRRVIDALGPLTTRANDRLEKRSARRAAAPPDPKKSGPAL